MLMSGKLIGYANPPTSPSRSLKRPDTHIRPFVSRHFCAFSSVKHPLTCAFMQDEYRPIFLCVFR